MRSDRLENIWPFSLCQKWTEEMDVAWQGKKVCALSAEKWLEREQFLKENFPWKFWAEDKLDDLRNSINEFIDRYLLLRDVRCYYSNRFDSKTHLLRTTVKKGEWAEIGDRLFDAIMLANVDFIEKDNFDHQKAWADDKEEVTIKPWEVTEYEKKQRGEPNAIDGKRDGDENDHGMSDHQWQAKLAFWEAYNWYKNEYPLFEKKDDELHSQTKHEKTGSFMAMMADDTHKDHNKKIYEQIWALEKQLEDEKVENMIKIVKHNNSMWT